MSLPEQRAEQRADRLAALIRSDGPLPVSAYMTLCLHDPVFGYYACGAGLGRDFTTAPETSQAFGELLGLWSVQEWQALGRPERLNWVELGPGSGALMADALRASAPQRDFRKAAAVHLVEASEVLRRQQAGRLASAGVPVEHVPGLEAVAGGPMILLANEFLDCLPARQFVRVGAAWHERVVGLDDHGALVFGRAGEPAPDLASLSAPEPAPAAVPAGAPGAIVEVQPGLDTLIAALARRKAPFRALFLDYGPADGPPGDTLRAYSAGQQVDPLAEPGRADLTVDVDFARLGRLARAAGLSVHGPIPQGHFLMALGLQARLNQLMAAHPDRAEALHAAASRLIDPAEMGTRFKAICLSSPGLATRGLPPPAGF